MLVPGMFSKLAGKEFTSDKKVTMSIAQMTKCFWVTKELKLMVFDQGGATDLSPTKQVCLSIHNVGEVGSTYANFLLGTFYSVVAVEQIGSAADTVILKLIVEDLANSRLEFKVHYIDVTKALKDVKKAHAADARSNRNGGIVNVETSIKMQGKRF
jgi:hypothetical protein